MISVPFTGCHALYLERHCTVKLVIMMKLCIYIYTCRNVDPGICQLGRVLSLKTAEIWRTNTYYKLNLQFTHFIAVSLKTHLYGAANKNTSDGWNPAEKENDELDCLSLLLKLWRRDSTHKTNSHNVKAHVVVTNDYGEGLALYLSYTMHSVFHLENSYILHLCRKTSSFVPKPPRSYKCI